MPKAVKIILSLVILTGIGVWVFSMDPESNANDGATNSPTSSQQTSQDIPEDWEIYSNAQYDFSIAHPPKVSVQAEGAGEQNHIKFTYLGSDNATGEITDGFTLTISSYDTTDTDAASLRSFAEAQIENNPVSDVVKPVEDIQFHGQPAVYYQTKNLGIVNHTVVENDDAYVVISTNVSDPNNAGYDDIVTNMKASLQLKEVTGGDTAEATKSEVKLAMLDTDISNGEEATRGCDRVAMITRDIDETAAPLTAAMEVLFSLERENVEGFTNFIARTNDTLSFDRATVVDGTANIYLSGELSGLRGVCDNPRARIQIEETALQFATVEDVQIYLNGEPTELQPSGRGQ